MPIYLDSSEPGPARDLFGAVIAKTDDKRPRARSLVVWCPKCNKLDSVFLGGGVKLSAARCRHCSGEVVTGRARAAKLKFYEAVMDRNLALTISAAHGSGDIDAAAEYAEYAAHTAYKLRLVPYGPEPSR